MELSYFDYGLIALLFMILFYYFGTRGFDRFKECDVKHYRPFPWLGNMASQLLLNKNFLKVIDDTYNGFPDERYFGAYEFRRPIVWLRDPELIKHVTVKDFDHFVDHRSLLPDNIDPLFTNNLFVLTGQKWKDMRSTLSPAFTSSKMKQMFPFILNCSEQLVNYLKSEIESNETKEYYEIEVKDLFTRYTNDVIATSAFGINIDSLKNKNNEFFKMGTEITAFSTLTFLKILGYMWFPALMKLLRVNFMKKDVADFFRSMVFQTMKEREDKHIIRPDMIHLLMQAKKGNLKDDDASMETNFENKISNNELQKTNKRVWTDDEIASQAFLFFLAGFETSSTLLTYTAYEIATRQDIQDKLKEEIDDILDNKKEMTYEQMSKMIYMDMFIYETLRFWPPAPGTDRVCVKPYTLPPPNETTTKQHKVQVGEQLFIPTRALHRDPKYFPDPDKFIPERFSEENKLSIEAGAYIPFGYGPRNCIGSRFAMMEIKALLISMLLNFSFVPCSKTKDPSKSKMNLGRVLPRDGIWIGIKCRNEI